MADITIDRIINMSAQELNKLSTADLKEIVNYGARIANRRIETLEKSGVPSAALSYRRGLSDDDKALRFSQEPDGVNMLRHEVSELRNFLGAESSTVPGANRVISKSIAKLKKAGINITRGQYKTFWKAYNKTRKSDPALAERGFKYAALQALKNIVQDKPLQSVEEIASTLKNNLQTIYEENQLIESEDLDNGFYEIEDEDEDFPF